jgi:serine/threonine protein kinase
MKQKDHFHKGHEPRASDNGGARSDGGSGEGPREPDCAESASGVSAGAVRSGDVRVIAALETYLESMRAGQPFSASEFLAQHADISADLSRCFAGLEFIEAAAAELSATTNHPAAAPTEPALPPESRLGDYHILREIGRGGMGVVYDARQVSLGRRVALKVLPYSAAADPKQRQRFHIEAQAAAQLHHPHIVPIFGVGCDAGMHYYAMQFVDGNSLSSIIRDLRSGDGAIPAWPDPSVLAAQVHKDEDSTSPGGTENVDLEWDLRKAHTASASSDSLGSKARRDGAFCRKVARLGTDAADALEHAHSLGVLHRDIKPANLLIDREGSVWITDFGLARFSGDSSLTGTGDVVGTLRYMSPEQALARRGVVDQRTDVYALGATLYELLTLRPAFGGRDHQELLQQIALDEPVPPRRLNPVVPRDLETIVLKAMAKDPSGRYATALELSEDLKRFLNDDPIMGRRPGSLERTVRWARRRWELVATSAAIVMISLIIGAAVTWNEAGKTKKASNKYHHFIVTHFALLDRSAKQQMVNDQVLKMYQEASELPPADREARTVIARALCRLASARTILCLPPGGGAPLNPSKLSQAGSEFRRSIALFEGLLDQDRSDRVVRRYYADALGLLGHGCYLRFTNCGQEAERSYRRAIELRRDLVLGTDPGSVAGSRPRVDDPEESEDVMLLVYTVQVVAEMMKSSGREAAVDRLHQQLEDDIRAAGVRYSGPEYWKMRQSWVKELVGSPQPLSEPSSRRAVYRNTRLALFLDPENAHANNAAAWALVSLPDDPWFDPKEGLRLAQKALNLEANNWAYWNTLGVAAFRSRDWTIAQDALKKSIGFTGGTAHDWFFLAMTRWHQGNHSEARQDFELALAAMKNERKDDQELIRFHAEAAALLGVAGPESQIGVARKASATEETMQN